MDLCGKTYVVTGATSGIGQATIRLLAQRGAMVIGTGRSSERCEQTQDQMRLLTGNPGVFYLTGNLGQQGEVKDLAARIRTLLDDKGNHSLDGLVNNAGTYTFWLTLTGDGVERGWAVNHFAPFILTHELLPCLERAPFGRVVTVSSESHQGAHIHWDDLQQFRNYNGLNVYGETKLANILFTQELDKRLKETSTIRAFAVDPGLVNTEIGKKGTPGLVNLVWDVRRRAGISPEKPAICISYLLSEPSIQTSQAIYWKNSHPRKASRRATDISSAKRLWTYSKSVCGIEKEI